MPTLTAQDLPAKAKRRFDYESSRPVWRAVCAEAGCTWHHECGEDVHVEIVKALGARHANREGHVVETRFDILNQLNDRIYPRRVDER